MYCAAESKNFLLNFVHIQKQNKTEQLGLKLVNF